MVRFWEVKRTTFFNNALIVNQLSKRSVLWNSKTFVVYCFCTKINSFPRPMAIAGHKNGDVPKR